jgi:hypothetical protein
MHMDCDPCDYPHVVALFARTRGAISVNGAVLRFATRCIGACASWPPISTNTATGAAAALRSYSTAFDLRRIDPRHWVTHAGSCSDVDARLAALRHYPLVSPRQAARLSRRDPFERRAAALVEYPPPRTRHAG